MLQDRKKESRLRPRRWGGSVSLYLMLLPAVAFLLLFVYYPFVSGIRLAFMDVNLVTGKQEFVGWEHFQKLLDDADFWRALWNTAVFGVINVALGIILPAGLALLLNEVRSAKARKTFQVIIYLPSLFSWVVIGSIFQLLLSPTTGPVNAIIKWFGGEPVYFFAKPEIAKLLFILLAHWKGVGYGIIVYLAAITNIDPVLYEAAELDGAGRWKKMAHVTLPGITGTTKTMFMFAVIGILAIFDQVIVLNNGIINDKVNVIMTYIYGEGIQQLKMGYAAAAALMTGVLTLAVTLLSKKVLRFGFEGEN